MRKITGLFVVVALLVFIQVVFPNAAFGLIELFTNSTQASAFADAMPSLQKSANKDRPGFPHVNYDDPLPAVRAEANSANSPAVAGATADFDSDGVPDLIAADAAGNITFFKGNADTIYPNSPEAKANREQFGEPAPFSLTSLEMSLPFKPDFCAAGDFNADGYSDILAAARGGNLMVLIAGNGRGGFAQPQPIGVPGRITSLATGEVGRIDGQTDVAVGIQSEKGSFLLIYEHPEGAFRHKPEAFILTSPATDLAIGQLDNDPYADIAAACGSDLIVVHGRGQAYPLDLKADLDIQRPVAKVQTRHLPFRTTAIAIGNFGRERGDSLALLSESGSVALLKRTEKIVSQRRLEPADLKNVSRAVFAPADADARNFAAIKRDQIRDEKQAELSGQLMMDTEKRKEGFSEYMAEKARTDNEKFEKLPADERSRILSDKAAKAIETKQLRKEAFEKNLAGQPSDLTKFELETISYDGRLANAVASGAKNFMAARVSDSGHDDLIVADPVSKQIHIIYLAASNETISKGQGQAAEVVSLGSETIPRAIIPMRLNSDALSDLVVLGEGSAVPTVVETVSSLTLVVNTTDNDSGGNCDGTSTCALRRAIFIANSNPGLDTITFNIPGAGVHTIHPTTVLPDVSGIVVIDGTTQLGFAGTPLIEIEGDLLSGACEGLKVRASGSVIRGLAVNHIPSGDAGSSQIGGSGITVLSTSNSPNVTNVIVEGNFLGTDPTGEFKKGNDANGVHIFDADHNTVGGTTPQARNILSGNGNFAQNELGVGLAVTGANYNQIQGNYIGADASGVVKLGNSYGVYFTGINNQFGGDAAGAANLVSGNGGPLNQYNQCAGGGVFVDALYLASDGTLITDSNNFKGNLIGTTYTGEAPLGNCYAGLSSYANLNTTIGSITESGRNVISDNGNDALYCTYAAFSFNRLSGGCVIVGNNIGTDKAGNFAMPNDQRNNGCVGFCLVTDTIYIGGSDLDFVIVGSPGGTTSGGACTGLCNLISGNYNPNTFGGGGVFRVSFGIVLVVNNYLGTNRAGTAPLPNTGGVTSYYGGTVIGAEFSDGNGGLVDGGNVVSGNGGAGIHITAIDGGAPWEIRGNLLGLSSDGNNPIPNGITNTAAANVSVTTQPGTEAIIGGTGPLQKNFIAAATSDGNGTRGDGLSLNTYGTARVVNNWIGLNKFGAPMPNSGNGITATGTGRTFIGGVGGNQGNVIFGNGKAGVFVFQFVGTFGSAFAHGVTIRDNIIANNGGLGIDLGNYTQNTPLEPDGVTPNDCQDVDTGANALQNFPELYTPVPTANGGISVPSVLRSFPGHPYTIDFYANNTADPTNYGEGGNLIGSTTVTTDGNGFVNFTFVSPNPVDPSKKITATATDYDGNTSEFSCFAGQCFSGDPRAPEVACGNPIIVTVDTNEDDANIADGVCDVDTNTTGLQCSLRAAIQESNARTGFDVITFDIPGAGLHTISIPVAQQLPDINDKVLIDAISQPGYVDSPIIEVRGEAAGNQIPAVGFRVRTTDSTINGLVINQFGIDVSIGDANSSADMGRNSVENSYIGINADGMSVTNTVVSTFGIAVLGNSKANVIGGSYAYGGNVIGNCQAGLTLSGAGVQNNTVTNNKIGTNKTGVARLDNVDGVIIGNGARNNVIGGELDTDTNLISGNFSNGITISSSATLNRISGNLIGTTIDGNGALPNGQSGINLIGSATQNTIGGNTNQRNVISGNGGTVDPNIGFGIQMDFSASQNKVYGNYIGVNKDGSAGLGNIVGIGISGSNNTIGGVANSPNTISGNQIGISLATANPSAVNSNVISYNRLGTTPDGYNNAHNALGIMVIGNVINTNINNNVISGNNTFGVILRDGSSRTTISNNRIGTTLDGTAALANIGGVVVSKSTENTISGNQISGNTTTGVFIGEDFDQQPAGLKNELQKIKLPFSKTASTGASTSSNNVQSNLIGTTADGNSSLPNGASGVNVGENAQDNLIGGITSQHQGNTISGNDQGTGGYGILLGAIYATTSDRFPQNNKIQSNRIGIKSTSYSALPNKVGIKAIQATNNLIGGDPDACNPGEPCDLSGYANMIGGNLGAGINIEGVGASNNRIVANFVGVAPDGTIIGNGADGVLADKVPDITIQENTIGGNGANGILVQGDDPPAPVAKTRTDFSPMLFNKKILGNLVGVIKVGIGTIKVSNILAGIRIHNAQGVQVGNDVPNAVKNLIGGNGGPGVLIEGPNATGNEINSSIIGTDENGTPGLGNDGDGVKVQDAPDNIIGDPIGGDSRQNVIAGNSGDGIAIEGPGASHNSMLGNLVGVIRKSGILEKIGNLQNGIAIRNAASNIIGNTSGFFGNTVSGNGFNGVMVSGSQSIGNQIKQNLIGAVDAIGSPGFGNSLNGIHVLFGANNTTIGGDEPNAANTISDNGGKGIWIDDTDVPARRARALTTAPPFSNDIRRNLIFRNTDIGIDIGLPGPDQNDPGDADEGANRGQNYPVIDNFSIDGNGDLLASYILDSDPANANYGGNGIYIQFFKSDLLGQGQSFLNNDYWTAGDQNAGSLKTVNLGNAAALGFTLADLMTATATDANNNTSEFVPVGALPSPTPTATPAIGGTVAYGNAIGAPAVRFVSNVLLSGAGSPPISALTGPDGTYLLNGFGSGAYTITPSKTGGQNNSLSSFDAALVAQHVVGPPFPHLTGSQLLVADVSGNGDISSFDAAEIAHYVVSNSPSGNTGNWIFSPASNFHAAVNSSVSGEDYSALLLGEVSGNWDGSGSRPAKGPERSVEVKAPQLVIESRRDVIIPILIYGTSNKGIISFEFDLRYDPLVLRPQVNPVDLTGTISRDLTAVANPKTPGLLRIAVYGATPIDGDGILLNLRFTAVGLPGSTSPLIWERILFNEGNSRTIATDGQVKLSPEKAK